MARKTLGGQDRANLLLKEVGTGLAEKRKCVPDQKERTTESHPAALHVVSSRIVTALEPNASFEAFLTFVTL
jgi:hypothetical protein